MSENNDKKEEDLQDSLISQESVKAAAPSLPKKPIDAEND